MDSVRGIENDRHATGVLELSRAHRALEAELSKGPIDASENVLLIGLLLFKSDEVQVDALESVAGKGAETGAARAT